MSARLTREQKDALAEALAALETSYDEGDDGDPVRLALNAIAGILGELAGVPVGEEDSLIGVLVELDADEDLQKTVVSLYETAGEGAYGEGLSEEDADTINGLLDGLDEELRELVRTTRPKTRAPRSRKK